MPSINQEIDRLIGSIDQWQYPERFRRQDMTIHSRLNAARNYLDRNNIAYAPWQDQSGGDSITDAGAYRNHIEGLESLMDAHRRGTARQQNLPNMSGSGLAPEELVREAGRVLSADRARLGSMNYPVYRGQTRSPMSTATQRAQAIRERGRGRDPYAGRIERVLARSGEGINNANIQGLLQRINEQQGAFRQGVLTPALAHQFSSSFEPRAQRFNERSQRITDRFIPEARSGFDRIAAVSNNLESTRNQQTAQMLQGMQNARSQRYNSLASNLEQFGNQRHAYNNMVNRANRSQFDQEVREPFERMDRLQQAIAPHQASMGQEVHPDLQRSQADEVRQALNAYGVDTARPTSEWTNINNRRPASRYPGQLVAPLPGEIQVSGDILEGLEPTLRDANTDRRRALTRSLVENDTAAATALQNVPGASEGRISQLERQARDRFRDRLNAINNQYIRLNQYGSEQHIRAAERAAREIDQAVLEQRNNEVQNTLANQLQTAHSNDINSLRQLGTIATQGQRDYNNLLGDVRELNRQGAIRFANDQDENEQLYRNYQNERLWEWPHMRSAAMRSGQAQGLAQGQAEGRHGALGEVFSGLADRNISLENLANLNTGYDSLQRENSELRRQLGTFTEAREALQRSEREAAQRRATAEREQNRLRHTSAMRDWEEIRRGFLANQAEYQRRYNEDVSSRDQLHYVRPGQSSTAPSSVLQSREANRRAMQAAEAQMQRLRSQANAMRSQWDSIPGFSRPALI